MPQTIIYEWRYIELIIYHVYTLFTLEIVVSDNRLSTVVVKKIHPSFALSHPLDRLPMMGMNGVKPFLYYVYNNHIH